MSAAVEQWLGIGRSRIPLQPLPGLVEKPGKKCYLSGMNAVVSEKGQVTIPKALRDRLGIHAGQVLAFEEEEGRLVARKVMPADPLATAWGILQVARSSDEILSELRGDDAIA